MNVRRSVAALGERQRGVVTRAQLERIGVTAGQARSLVRSGTLVREAKGVYRCAGAPRTYEQTVALALAATGPGAVASHRCAARLYHLGVPWFAEAAPEITVPAGTHALGARRFAIVHGARHLDPRDRAQTAGLATTGPLRVAVGCAGLGEVDPDAYRDARLGLEYEGRRFHAPRHRAVTSPVTTSSTSSTGRSCTPARPSSSRLVPVTSSPPSPTTWPAAFRRRIPPGAQPAWS